MSDQHDLPPACEVVRHLKWTLEMDWSELAGGNPLTNGWTQRTTGWREGQPGTAEWLEAVSSVQTPSWGALQQAHFTSGLNPRFRTESVDVDGRHYGWYDQLEKRTIRKLDVDGVNDVSAMARGVRGFLDIVHIRPFTNGNIRAACTWLAWSFVDGDIDVADLAPMLEIAKPAGNELVPVAMARLLGGSVKES